MGVSLAEIGRHRALVAVTLLQAACALLFLADLLSELPELRSNPVHPLLELATVGALWFGSVMGALEIRRLVSRNRHLTDRLRAASGAFVALLEETFTTWGLTRSERDVALLTIKGLSVSEIAGLRATRAGTVRAQCAAVYRKAGVDGRAQLISHFVEDLMAGVNLEMPQNRTEEPGPATQD